MEERKQPGSIPVGISNFEKIRRENYYYVDKSELLQELLKTSVPEVTLITRPRRFGTTRMECCSLLCRSCALSMLTFLKAGRLIRLIRKHLSD